MIEVEFKIISILNPNIYQEGYVEMPDDAEEDVEWNYYGQNGEIVSRQFTHHDEIGLTQIGATDEQKWEIDSFLTLINTEYVDWVNDVICNSDENEQRTYVKEGIIIHINGGAKFDVKIEDYDSDEWDSEYYLAFTPYMNDNPVTLDENCYFEDPFTYEDTNVSDILHENGAYIVEVPKSYFTDDDLWYDELHKKYCKAFESVYKESVAHDLGVYGIAVTMLEEKLKSMNDVRIFDESYIQDFGNSVEDEFVDKDLLDLCATTDDIVIKRVNELLEDV